VGISVFDAIAKIRDAVAYAEVTGKPMCILSLEFRGAFYNIGHDYLFVILNMYYFSDRFAQRIKSLYTNATSSVHINEYTSKPIPIKSSIRQGCPLSKILYTKCLNPLLNILNHTLTGLKIGRKNRQTSVVEFTDDVTIFLTSPADILKLQDAMTYYEKASSAKVNLRKSKTMALGS
jgi:hypothetical protein